MRGSVHPALPGSQPRRFIPARAGIGRFWSRRVGGVAVHPRSCGDRVLQLPVGKALDGSSPLVRGSAAPPARHRPHARFIPARAGIGTWVPLPPARPPVHPRSCGDRASRFQFARDSSGSSPLVRGSVNAWLLCLDRKRFIPARAGIGKFELDNLLTASVHPRSCGDRPWWLYQRSMRSGSSPLVRGSAFNRALCVGKVRFIPARAGIGCSGWPWVTTSPVHPRSCGDRAKNLCAGRPSAGSSPLVRGSATQDTTG